jgi:hypothetical protein
MATTLRELIVKVVFRADPTQLQEFDDLLAQAKAKLVALDAEAKKGLTPAVDPTPLSQFAAQAQAAAAELLALQGISNEVGEKLGASTRTAGESFIALRDSVQSIEGSLDPAQVEEYSAAFAEAQQTADDVRNAINRLRLTDPKNAELPALEAQLKAVEFEAEQTATALKGVGVATKTAAPGTAQMSEGLGGLTKWLARLSIAGAAYKALNWGKNILTEAAAVGDLASRLSIGTDELQQWTAFAEQAGSSSEDLAGTVKSLAKNIQNAGQDAKGPAAKGFERLGISTKGWKDTLPSTTDVLLAAGGALGELTNDTERMALAQELLGEAGLKMLPAFAGGTEAAKEQLAAMKELAVVYDDEFIKAASAAQNEMALFGRQLDGVGAQIVLAVLPSLREFVRWVTPLAKGIRNLVRDSSMLWAALGVGAQVGVSKAIAVVGKLITRFGGFTNIVKAGGRILLRFVLPFLVLDDIITFLRGGKSVFGDILDGMLGVGTSKAVLESLKAAWEGLSGTVQYFWGLLKGDQAAIDAGEAKILKFGGAVDDVLSDFAEAWDFALKDAGQALISFGELTFEWGNLFSEAWDLTLKNIGDAFVDWGTSLSDYFSGLWASIVNGLAQMVADAVAKVQGFAANLPLIGSLFKAEEPAAVPPAEAMARNAQAGLALGGAPAVSNAKATTVTVNDSSSVNTTLNGVDGENVGAALRQSEKNVSEQLKRNKAQVLRQTVGAASI